MKGNRLVNPIAECVSNAGGWRYVTLLAIACALAVPVSAQTNTIRYVAIGASGQQCANGEFSPAWSCDWYLDGSGGLVLNSVPQTIFWELRLDEWGTPGGFPDDPLLSYQHEIYCDSLFNGTACFEPAPGLAANQCTSSGGQFGVDYCNGIDQSRPDYVYFGSPVLTGFPNTTCQDQVGNGGYCPTQTGSGLGSMPISADNAPSYTESGSISKYGGQFAAVVPAGARGVFNIDIHPSPDLTAMRTTGGQSLTPLNLIPMQVEIVTGSCCSFFPPFCLDDVVASECEDAGGFFYPRCVCSGVDSNGDGIDDGCYSCKDASCDDGNACTIDDCPNYDCPGATCTYSPSPVAANPSLCCNPNTGDGTPLSDGNPCTEDICEYSGEITHEPIPAGGACVSPNECITNATCSQAGFCIGQSVVGMSCTDDEDCGLGLCLDGGCVCVPSTGCCLDDACFAISESLCLSEGGQPLASCRDIDLDGASGCDDLCPEDPAKIEPGECGCGVADTDSDGDTVPNCFDICPGGDDFLDEDGDGVPDECAHPFTIPTVSAWGLAILALLLLVVGKLSWNKRLAT